MSPPAAGVRLPFTFCDTSANMRKNLVSRGIKADHETRNSLLGLTSTLVSRQREKRITIAWASNRVNSEHSQAVTDFEMQVLRKRHPEGDQFEATPRAAAQLLPVLDIGSTLDASRSITPRGSAKRFNRERRGSNRNGQVYCLPASKSSAPRNKALSDRTDPPRQQHNDHQSRATIPAAV